MKIHNDPVPANQVQIGGEKESNPSRVKINKETKNKPQENDPFDLELRIEPSDIQRIIAGATDSKYCGSDDNCTGCGCNTCCSSC
jgi:hypothetical protein